MAERGRVSLTRLMLLWTAALALCSLAIGENVVLLPAALLVSVLVCLGLLVTGCEPDVPASCGVFVVACVLVVAYIQFLNFAGGWVPLLLVAYAGLGLAACLSRRLPRATLAAFLALHLVLVALLLTTLPMVSDVQALMDGAASALVRGVDPYAITVPGVYGPDHDWVYGPGVLRDGRIQYGYPYLPVPLLVVLPAYLLGDIRLALVAATVLTSWIIATLATDRLGRVAAVMVLVMPVGWAVQINYWVEPVLLLAVALTSAALVRRTSAAALWFGCFLASKQYAIIHLPLLWMLARRSGKRGVLTALAVPLVLCSAFFLWDPSAFWHSAVEFHLRQPYRPDTVTLTPLLERLFGNSPDVLFGPYGLVLGSGVSALISWRCRPSPATFSAGIGLSLAVAVLFSKQGHANYWGLIGGALLIAVATSAGDLAETRSTYT